VCTSHCEERGTSDEAISLFVLDCFVVAMMLLLAMTGNLCYNIYMALQRKCSCCRRPGHTKTNCPLKGGKTKETKNKWVSIKVASPHTKSQHIVDLKEKKFENHWNGVVAFRERAPVPEERAVVDWAEMVRTANQLPVNRYQLSETKNRVAVIDRKILISVICYLKYVTNGIRNKFVALHQFFSNTPNVIFSRQSTGSRISSGQSFNLRSLNYRRFAYGAVVIFLLIAIPFPAVGYYQKLKTDGARVVSESTNAFLALQSSTVAALQSNFEQAQTDLNLALESFGNAQSILEKEHNALVYVMSVLPIVGREVESRQHLLLAGHHLALGNTYLVKGIRDSGADIQMPMTDKLNILSAHLRSAIPQYEEALQDLSQVGEASVPVEFQQSFYDFKILFSAFVDDMKDLRRLAQSIDKLLGSEQPRRYLVIFQNPAEIRPTGGFMGSFGLLDIQKGRITNFEIPGGGTYDVQGQLDVFIKPPLPLQLVNKRWEFQDSNWFPDFPTAAEKMAWFYQHGRNTTVDGVIAVNASVLERLLGVLGPLVSDKFGLELSSSDALSKIQKQVEVDYDREENRPKEIIGELAQQILNRTQELNSLSAVRLAAELNEALSQKEILVYLRDGECQTVGFDDFGWTGSVEQTKNNQDYLLAINANVGGNKTDARVTQTIEHQAVMQDDGTMIDSVVITRENNSREGEEFYGGNNIDYLRVYVPQGSELIDAGGFNYPPEGMFKVPEHWYQIDADLTRVEKEKGIQTKTGTRITSEFNKTVFGNWVITPPGEKSIVYFTYKLPFRVSTNDASKDYSSYSLLVQKQSGVDGKFATRIIYPQGWQPVWGTSKDLDLASNGAEYNGELDSDKALGVVMERKR